MKYVESTFVALLAFFAPLNSILLVTGTLVVVDLITGVAAARKAGTPLTSRRLGHTVVKMLAYHLAILSGFLIEKVAFGTLPPLPISSITSSVIALTEFKSIIENITVITGRDLWQEILEKIGKRGDK